MAARPFLKRWWMRKAEWEQTQAGTHRLWRLMVPEGKQREPRRLAAGCLSYCCCCCSWWRLPRVTFDKHVMVFSESTSSFSLECKKVGECFRKGDLLFFFREIKTLSPWWPFTLHGQRTLTFDPMDAGGRGSALKIQLAFHGKDVVCFNADVFSGS